MKLDKNHRMSKEQRLVIFNARRALFIYTSFHLMMALFVQFYSQRIDPLGLLNIILFPLCFLVLGIWSMSRAYQAFSLAVASLILCLSLQVYFQNLVGLAVLMIVIYFVNQGRAAAFGVQTGRTGRADILDAELED